MGASGGALPPALLGELAHLQRPHQAPELPAQPGAARADVALLYPVTTIQANWFAGAQFGAAAADAANTAYGLACSVYEAGIDLGFIGPRVARPRAVESGRLKVSGLEFRVLLPPPLSTVRTATLAKVREFWEGGGTVIAFRALPGASAEQGRDDPAVLAILEKLRLESTAAHRSACAHRCTEHRVFGHPSPAGGMACFVPSEATEHYLTVAELIGSLVEQDVVASEPGSTTPTGAPPSSTSTFCSTPVPSGAPWNSRVDGQPELWDVAGEDGLEVQGWCDRAGRKLVRPASADAPSQVRRASPRPRPPSRWTGTGSAACSPRWTTAGATSASGGAGADQRRGAALQGWSTSPATTRVPRSRPRSPSRARKASSPSASGATTPWRAIRGTVVYRKRV